MWSEGISAKVCELLVHDTDSMFIASILLVAPKFTVFLKYSNKMHIT